MPQGATLSIEGYREFMMALARADKDTRRETRAILRRAGDSVKADAASKIMGKDPKTAAGYRTMVRQRGVDVEQALRKSAAVNRRRPGFGGYQMRHALVPALEENEEQTVRAFEIALDEICARFNGGVVVG